ncbi:MAG TPA: hypothetical protein PLO70_07915 [Chitinophagaceae bacterium]|nr:hypothetical protein [Chitinophagaceae bacterium]HQX72705.1 hypothetical protein [Chitinophagaceae bacterium]HQZ74428.1 hypothetical protein [Chitinophagaceae bacterium]
MLRHFLLFISASFITATSLAQTYGIVKFNNVPFTNGSEAGKTSFKSNEFIYARVELEKSVKEYFKITNPDGSSKPHVLIFKFSKRYTEVDGKNYSDNFTNGEYLYIKPEDLSKTYIDLDILPDPAMANDVFCLVSNFQGGMYTSPIYRVRPKGYKNNSTINYSIQLVGGTTVANNSGNENLPKVTGTFDLLVNHSDEPLLKQNSDLADKKVQANGLNLSSLPTIFSRPFKTTDPKLTAAKLTAILKRDYPHRKVLKMALDSDGGQLWLVSKNDFGIPRYRYFNGLLHVAYMEDGVCKVGSVELIENYLGGGKYAALAADYWSEYDRTINCTAVK